MMNYAELIPPAFRGLRPFPMDGALLLFDRRSGLSVLLDGSETEHLRMRAPRVIQFAITNGCNLACHFCSRDTSARSTWTVESAFTLLRAMDCAGTLEVAFGGGEPLAFRGIVDLLGRLSRETQLAVSMTTNGTLLTEALAAELAPLLAQVRLSIYEDIDWARAMAALVAARCRFGINYLVTPQRLPWLESRLLEFAARGCCDMLLLSYNGRDASLHLSHEQTRQLAARVALLERALRGRVALKLDICWGERLESVPTLLGSGPCPAGREFVVVTSDRKLSPCSFHHLAFPIESASELLEVWRRQRVALALPARDPGCARATDYGLSPRNGLLRRV